MTSKLGTKESTEFSNVNKMGLYSLNIMWEMEKIGQISETNGATNTPEKRLFLNSDLNLHTFSESTPTVTFPLDGAENLLTCTMRLCA